MNIVEAIERMKRGEKIRNRKWVADDRICLYMGDGTIYMTDNARFGATTVIYVVTQLDLIEGDWEVVVKKPLRFEDLDIFNKFYMYISDPDNSSTYIKISCNTNSNTIRLPDGRVMCFANRTQVEVCQ